MPIDLLTLADVEDTVLLFIVWAIYRVDLKSKSGRKIDQWVVVCLSTVGFFYLVFRTIKLFKV